jgi:hypothetical protein
MRTYNIDKTKPTTIYGRLGPRDHRLAGILYEPGCYGRYVGLGFLAGLEAVTIIRKARKTLFVGYSE